METQIKVLHIDTEKTWRGGQQQAIYLHEGLLKRGYKSLFICNPDSELSKYCKANSLPYETFSMRGEVDVIAARKIAGLCRLYDINILHCHSAHALSIGVLVKLFRKQLILIGVRRVDFHTGKNILSRWKYNNGSIDKIICISEKIKNVMEEDGVPGSRLVTIRSGINLHKFDSILSDSYLREEYNIDNSTIVIGTIAAFVGHKDYFNLAKAAKIVLETNSSVKFVWVGDGKLIQDIKEKVREYEITDSIVFTGYREDVGRFLRLFDLFVLASREEGLGTSILDAQSIGLPVVATKAGGIPEIIGNGKNGLLVEPQNPEALAEAVLELLSDSEKREQLGNAAKISVRDFDINTTIDENIELYTKLIK